MSMLDGAAEQALKDFGGDFRDGVLLMPGEGVSDGQGGFTAGTPTPHPCKVLITDYSDYRRQALGIPATDRQALVLAASLPSGVVPAAGHDLTAPDPSKGGQPGTFQVIAKSGDPASALYKLQVR